MKFDKKAAEKLSKKEESKILLKKGIVFDFVGGMILIFGLLVLAGGLGLSSLVFIIPGVALIAVGFKNLLLKNEKRKNFLTSELLKQAIKEEKRKGNKLSKEEIEKIKFEYDPIFRDKVITGVHKDQDNKYFKNVKNAAMKVKFSENARQNEIQKLANERWKSVGNKNLKYNLTEGKIRINQTEHLFNEIKGAEINKTDSYRVVTTGTGKSKKHVSLGKAVLGGALFGPVGAIVGGAMGKTTTNSKSTSNSIPTCNHIGVIADISGFKSEIVVLNHTVDHSSRAYMTSLQNAEEIVAKLHFLATQPVPKTFKKVEEETSVLKYEKQIANARKELEKIKADKPTYDIPEKYLR